ncbi:hypothetical protein [Argonema antarcticum]|uniref:hypothetical protein n=1 Tax=Argonema antarcticum TaxID=2942763 RepID=UPI0020137FE9|nr:hypothetical protein [Argonema antarcticum]MCL1475878.1 hypothetical protein [Argonema antarcticum A004/B2]
MPTRQEIGFFELYSLNAEQLISPFENLFEGDKFGDILLENKRLKLLIFNPQAEEIIKWIS